MTTVEKCVRVLLGEDDIEDYADAAAFADGIQAERQTEFNHLVSEPSMALNIALYLLWSNKDALSAYAPWVGLYSATGPYVTARKIDELEDILKTFVARGFALTGQNEEEEDVYYASPDFMCYFNACPDRDEYLRSFAKMDRDSD